MLSVHEDVCHLQIDLSQVAIMKNSLCYVAGTCTGFMSFVDVFAFALLGHPAHFDVRKCQIGIWLGLCLSKAQAVDACQHCHKTNRPTGHCIQVEPTIAHTMLHRLQSNGISSGRRHMHG